MTAPDTDRLAEIDELTERLERLEHKHKLVAFSVIGVEVALMLVASTVKNLNDRPVPVSEWTDRRVEELERRLHMHIHPKEYTHHEP